MSHNNGNGYKHMTLNQAIYHTLLTEGRALTIDEIARKKLVNPHVKQLRDPYNHVMWAIEAHMNMYNQVSRTRYEAKAAPNNGHAQSQISEKFSDGYHGIKFGDYMAVDRILRLKNSRSRNVIMRNVHRQSLENYWINAGYKRIVYVRITLDTLKYFFNLEAEKGKIDKRVVQTGFKFPELLEKAKAKKVEEWWIRQNFDIETSRTPLESDVYTKDDLEKIVAKWEKYKILLSIHEQLTL